MRRLHILVGLILGQSVAHAQLASPASSTMPLPASMVVALQKANVPLDALGVVVQEVGSVGTPAISWRAEKNLNPASLMKLLTTSAALDLLGPAWTWATPVWLPSPQRQESGKGQTTQLSLIIKGSGDPTLVIERLWLLLRRVQQSGAQNIPGHIVLDHSAFALPPQDPADFDGDATRPYNATPDALLINYKSITLTFTPDTTLGVAHVSVEPIMAGYAVPRTVPLHTTLPCQDWRGALKADLTHPDRLQFAGQYPAACGEKNWPLAYNTPALYNAKVIQGLWQHMGGTLSGRVLDDGIAPTTTPSFEVTSPPLAEVVRSINKYSNNLMAQQLFLTLGLVQQGIGSPEAARAVLQRWLQDKLHTDTNTVIDNGSGLSRQTRISPALLTRCLQYAWASRWMPELMSSLPISGLDGTLTRFKTQTGQAHLKTGSLNGVVGIAGYVLTNTGKRYALTAIINHPNANNARPALEALVQVVGQGL